MDLNRNFVSLPAGLPEDIARLKEAGYYEEAIARIDARLAENWVVTENRPLAQGLSELGTVAGFNPVTAAPQAQAECLCAQREMLVRMKGHFPYTRAEALAMIQSEIEDFTEAEFDALDRENLLDWRFVNGERRFSSRFLSSLLHTDAALSARAGQEPKKSADTLRHAMQVMREKGHLSAVIRIRAEIRASDAAFGAALEQAKADGKRTVTVRAWLPVPAACPSQSSIDLALFSQDPTSIAPESAPQRTVFWQKELAQNAPFMVEYQYMQTARYQDLSACRPERFQPQNYLEEQLPHIRFSPYLRAVTEQLTAGTTDPIQKARRIYDFITMNVKYRFMPPYFTLEDIADNCVRSRRGDCGVMALAFITMCRIAGIPARWESGLFVMPNDVGCHDWARFYVAPVGWLYADCSFGAAAARAGDEARREHYFGNLDPYRMAANNTFGAQLTPPMEGWRADPWDNQTGEMELEGVGLYGGDVETKQTLLQFTEL